MTLAENPRLRQFFLSALYLAQGVPTGFVAIALAAFLAQQGASVGEIAALLAVTWLPWGCKVLYGPVLDRYAGSAMGRRRPWMLVAQGGMALTLGAMLALPGLDETLWLLAAMMFIHNLFGALLDVATDAAAVDLLGVQERGRANGLMWTGKLAGLALGGAGLGTVLAYAGLRPALALMLAFLLLTVLLPLLVRERPGDRRLARLAATPAVAGGTPQSFRHLLAVVRRLFREPATLVVALLALLAALPTRMMVTLGPVFAVQRVGWTDAEFTQFAGGPALLAGVAGALLGGWLVDRVGHRRVVAGTLAAIALFFMAIVASEPWWTKTAVVVPLLLFGIFFDMTLKIALVALFMQVTRVRVAATQFTIFVALSNLCNALGGAVVVPLDHWFDYRGIFAFAAVFALLTLVLVRYTPARAVPVPVAS